MENRRLNKNLVFPQAAFQRFWRSTSGKIGLILTVALISALLRPRLSPYDPAVDRDYLLRLVAPSAKHWFGTDGLGRDLLVRVWHGLGISLLVSLVSVGAGLILGALLGLVAGYFGGLLEIAIGTLADILLAFPSILLAIGVVTVTGPACKA